MSRYYRLCAAPGCTSNLNGKDSDLCKACEYRAINKEKRRADEKPTVKAPDLKDGVCFDSPFPNQWFDSDILEARIAVERCNTCPVIDACREYAIESRQQWGVWGGLTEVERSRIIRSRRRASA